MLGEYAVEGLAPVDKDDLGCLGKPAGTRGAVAHMLFAFTRFSSTCGKAKVRQDEGGRAKATGVSG